MSTVAEIKEAIEKLPLQERAELEALLWPEWDRPERDTLLSHSLSSVHRASRPTYPLTGAALLAFMGKRGPLFTEEELNSIDGASRMDQHPQDPE